MNITFNELRNLKHRLPTGSVSRIAQDLDISEQTVRNYFGAKKYGDATTPLGKHIQPGPNGGLVQLPDTRILDAAKKLLNEETSRAAAN